MPAYTRAGVDKGCVDKGVWMIYLWHTTSPHDGNCSGRFASYWNAFLFRDILEQNVIADQDTCPPCRTNFFHFHTVFGDYK